MRNSYIKQHRTILFILVVMWICPIWTNIEIQYVKSEDLEVSAINTLAFFSIVSSSGIITIVRACFDGYLRKKVKMGFKIDFFVVYLQEKEENDLVNSIECGLGVIHRAEIIKTHK